MVNDFFRFGKFKDLKQVFPYGKTKVQTLVRSGRWREGLHVITDEVGDRLYNLTLIADWVANLNDSAAHQRACERYLSSLPSNQPVTSGRRKRAAA